ncbi:hypothetical protein L1049_008734 [Liquidambar formosana]|uniref:Uncharacterized protein n=1 Tax=Liquidambar formosana TaxID=63359 RepID=A0AAP0S734_LIQFO
MKHIVKIMTLLVAISAFWIGLLKTSVVPHSHTWLRIKLNCYVAIFFPATYLPYCIVRMLRSVNGWSRSDALSNLSSRGIAVAAGCIGESTYEYGKRREADVIEAKEFLKPRGVGVGSD